MDDAPRTARGEKMKIKVKKLESTYWLVTGEGPCNWSQPAWWPCSENMLRNSASSEACEDFFASALVEAEKCDWCCHEMEGEE
jgi:hypothetical protein